MLAKSRTRVADHTSDEVNKDIRRQTELNIAYLAGAGREAVDKRLEELENEWDIERMLEANAATLALLGVGLGATVSPKWLLLPGIVTAFLLQHALQGWCPPVPVFRRLGFRTPAEIEFERTALKTIRGDFAAIPAHGANRSEVGRVIDAVRS
jgi:hypothetical protein